MSQLKSINIPQACHQSWQQMTPDGNGRHCQSCAKTVTDFTVMTNNEIIAYLSTGTNVCGRFGQQQLDSINRRLLTEDLPLNNKLKGWALVMGLLSSVSFFNACAQVPAPIVNTVVDIKRTVCDEQTLGKVMALREVKGIVTDNQNRPIPGALINIPSINYKYFTDVNGNFIMHVPFSIKQFTVNEVGYASKTVAISDSDENKKYQVKLREAVGLLGEVVIVPVKHSFVKRVYYKFIKRPIWKLFK